MGRHVTSRSRETAALTPCWWTGGGKIEKVLNLGPSINLSQGN